MAELVTEPCPFASVAAYIGACHREDLLFVFLCVKLLYSSCNKEVYSHKILWLGAVFCGTYRSTCKTDL